MNLLAPLYRAADWLRFRQHQNLGRRGEDLAHRYLRKRGWTVAARNWSPPQGGGEIDLIAWDGETLVFVEVKARASGAWGAPERQIDNDKMLSLRRAARDYMRRTHCEETPARFDVVTVTGRQLEYFHDAFALHRR